MLLTCSSCNSRYLLNSAELKPNGKTVKCAMCGHEWFQDHISSEEDLFNIQKNDNLTNLKEDKSDSNINTNLPAAYIEEKTPKLFNSIFIIIFISLAIVFFWQIKNEGRSFLVLFQYYLSEIYFNLKLIVSDFAKLIYQIRNSL